MELTSYLKLDKLITIFLFTLITKTTFCQDISVKVVFESEDAASVEVNKLQVFSVGPYRDSLVNELIEPGKTSHLFLSFKRNTLYRLLVYADKFETIDKLISADTLSSGIVLKLLFLRKPIDLKEITVESKRDRFIKSGDSLFINVKTEDARPHASSTSLFDRIPGLSNDFGVVSVLGKSVQEVTVDGRRVFGGNPTLTLDAIKADMVEQMEFVDKNLANGQAQNVLNLRLKPDKRKGGYGSIGSGIGRSGNYLINANYNKLTRNGFFNAFATANDVNQRGMDAKKANNSNATIMKNMMNRSGSIVGLYDNLYTEEEDIKTILTQSLEGINDYGDAGVNYTLTRNKFEIETFIFTNFLKGYLTKRTDSEVFLGKVEQNTKMFEKQRVLERRLNSNINLTWKPDSKTSIRFYNRLRTGFDDKEIRDTVLNTFKERFFENFIYSNSARKSADLEFNTQLSVIKSGKVRGELISILLNSSHLEAETDVDFLNSVQNTFLTKVQRSVLSNKSKSDYLSLQGNYARPVSKRILFEGKVKWIYDHKLNYQTPGSKTSDRYEEVKLENNLWESGLFAIYQRPRLKIVTGLTYLNWKISREKSQSVFNDRRDYVLNPFTKIELNLPNKVFWIRYAAGPVLPNWYQTGSLPDSSRLNSITTGNIELRNSFQRAVELNANVSGKDGLQINLNIGYKLYINPIVNTSLYNQEFNLYTNSYLNTGLRGSGLNANLTAFKVKLNSRFSSFYMAGLLHLNSYQSTDGEVSPIKTTIAFQNFNSSLKLNKSVIFRGNLRSQISILETKTIFNNTIYLSNELEMKGKWYLDSRVNLLLNKTQNNKFYSQQFLDFEISKFLFKNSFLKTSLILRNILNVKDKIQINQSNNFQSIQYVNFVPRVVMFHATIYPENWK